MRIVTLLPSATEIVARLGAAEQIVGISHECDRPASVLDRPRISATTLPDELGTRAIDARVVRAMVAGEPLSVVDAEQLAALEPDLVITQSLCTVCAVNATQIGLLDGMVNARVLALAARDFAGVLDDIRAVGEATELAAEAETLTDDLQNRWDALSAPDPAGPTVLFAEWPDPLWIGGHWVPEMVMHAGGVDPFGRPGEPSYRSSWREALARDPDVVVFAGCGYDLAENRQAAQVVPTGRARRYALDANALTSRGGPALVDGLQALRAAVRDDLDGVDARFVAALPPVG